MTQMLLPSIFLILALGVLVLLARYAPRNVKEHPAPQPTKFRRLLHDRGVMCALPPSVYLYKLGAAFLTVERLLREANVYTSTAFNGLTIVVADTRWWTSEITGQKVCSEFDAHTRCITVGNDLAGLAHEMCHAVEYRIDGKIDHSHTKWASRGFLVIENNYRRWLEDDDIA